MIGWKRSGITNADIELVAAQITTGVRSLDYHLLASNSSTRECQLVTSTTPASLAASSNINCRISICQVRGHCPW
jgi:hypothetical protein